MEFCPSCGEETEQLNEITGWCDNCITDVTRAVGYCVRCQAAFVSSLNEFICPSCKFEKWANEIERIMVLGRISFSRAKKLAATEFKATCVGCGDFMPHATKGRHLFCSKPKCKSASRRLKYLRLNKGKSHSEALSQVLNELHGEEAA